MFQKKIVLIQLGKRCTDFYENTICKIIKNNKLFHLTKYYTNFEEINKHLPYQFDYLVPKLSSIIENIKHDDVFSIIMPNITLHHTSDKLKEVHLFIHPVKESIKKLKKENIQQAYLFGSVYTMNSDEFKQQFSKQNIQLLNIEKQDQLFVDDFRKNIYNSRP